MMSDPTLERIRKVRHEISAQVGHDPEQLVDYYRRLQEQHRDRLISTNAADKQASDAPAA